VIKIQIDLEVIMTTEEILRANLTDEQYNAVVDESKYILCLACAGSGKSRTLAYKIDFGRLRQDEARFEISVKDALITGAIDLLLLEDPKRGIITADVIDFKSMETPEDVASYDWRDMSVQVQLYSKAAKEVLGENVETGYIHTLKDNQRTAVPVDNQSVNNAIGVIEWAVKGILIGDFPMRACQQNCVSCDFKAMCAQKLQAFKNTETPPQINTPAGLKTIAALDIESEGG